MSSPDQQDTTLVKQPLEPVQVVEDKVKQNVSDLSHQMQQSIMHSHSQDSLKNKVDLADSIVVNQNQQNQNQIKAQQSKIAQIPQSFQYEQNHQQKPKQDSPIPQHVVQMDGFFGYDSFKRQNPKILDQNHIIYSSGICYTIYNFETKQKQNYFSKQKGGIGCISVSYSKKYFAVAEMGSWPCVYVYEYPSLKLYRILRKGTQKTFSCMCFSNDDNLLVTVGSQPDFLITVWEWKQQRLMLKSKAFSQDVYRVSFSQFNQDFITTSGTGHIRFWKIAQTFTGLKLQGDIAKFGQFQLSDVVSYAQFEDGNVLSSSQYGKLLLWQGNLIKSVISIDNDTPCHKGSIQFVRLMDKQIITAGSDGYIRFWDYQEINNGQSDQYFNLFVKPKKQFYFQSKDKKPAYLNWIQIGKQFWLVQDAYGSLYKFTLTQNQRQQILSFNSGRFTDMSLSPLNSCCITTGNDGYVRLWDYGNKKQFYSRKFSTSNSQSTCVQWLPFSKRNSGRMIVVGFSDGIVRFLGLEQNNFKLIKALKVHKNSIIKIKANREGNVIAIIDTAGSIFFIYLDNISLDKIIPYCLFQTNYKINDACFDKTGQKLLIACQDGKLHELTVPKLSQCDYTQTFLKKFQSKSFLIKMMQSQKPKKQDLQLQLLLKKTKGGNVADDVIVDEQWQPAAILNATYYDSQCTKILCSVQGKYLGNYYIVDMNKQRPISSIQGSKIYKTSYLQYNDQTDMIFIGYRNGFWELRHKYDANLYLQKQSFDQNYGIVRKVAMNLENTAILTLSEDGTLICYKIDHSSFLKGSRGDTVEEVQVNYPPVILGISESTFADKIQFTKQQAQTDIQDSSIYCLQDEKIKAEQDMKLSQAQKIKLKKKKKVLELQQLYKQVIQANNNQTDYLAKLSPQQLIIDPQYANTLKKRVQQQIQQTKKVMLWDEYKSQLYKKKLQNYYLDNLQYNNFNVKGIKTDTIVSSFKLQKLSPYVQQQLQQIQRIIQSQQVNQKRSDKKNITMNSFQQTKAIMQNKINTKKGSKQDNSQQVRNKIRQAQIQFQKQLQVAESTMGDYKLKCSNDYAVPENQRLNVSRKKKHLFLHYQYLFLQKRQFNKRLDNLRIKKKQMVGKLDSINNRLRQINRQLETQQQDILFSIDQEIELLETQFQITQDDINQHIIFKQKQKQAAKKGSGGMGMGSNNDNKQQTKQQIVKKPRKSKLQSKKDNNLNKQPQFIQRKNVKVKKSALQQEYKQIKRIQLKTQKQRIKKNLFRQIQQFDNELDQLHIFKYQLQNDLTLVQMKLLVFTQQFIIFRDMQTYDNQLMTSIKNFSSDKLSMQNTFINLSTQISQIQIINQQLRKKFQDEKKILKQFVYPEDDQMRERIIRYYKIRQRKRIQKLKKQAELEEKQKQSDQDEEDNDEDQQSEDEEESEDQFEDEDQKPDINIIENDHKNFERVRKICQYDQKIQENSKRKSDLEKQRNQISTKMKNIDNQLIKAQKQLKIYQKKKLLKINQLFVSLPIKSSQIQYIINMNGRTKIMQDFSNGILFTYNSFDRLSERIQQLKKQKVDIQKKQKLLNRKLSKLTQQVSKSTTQIQSKRKQYEQKQLLKFGSTFEMQKLKQLQPTDQVIQIRSLYKKQQKQVSKKIQQVKQQLQDRKRQLLQTKRQNTRVITQITELGNKQNDLKKKLDSTNKQLFKNYDVSKKDQLQKQRQNLKDLIKFLSKEIQDLKTQIGLFKRKGGHIYTMVTSNKKNFS